MNPAQKPPASDIPAPREDENSSLAHGRLVEKARQGGIDLYFVGDSITRRWGTSDLAWRPMLENWTANFHGWNAGNFGWGADSTQNILWRLQNGELDGVHPKAIVLLAGTNNLGAGQSAGEVARGVAAILRTCREKAPEAAIVLTAIFPREDDATGIVRATNEKLKDLADEMGLRYLDVGEKLAGPHFVDGLHLSVEGYQVWADGLRPILTEILGPRAETDHAPPPTGDPSQP